MAALRLASWPLPLSVLSLIFGRRSVSGSNIGGLPETQEMLDFCGKHNITSDVEVIPIQKVNEAYERLLKSDVKYRFCIAMNQTRTCPRCGNVLAPDAPRSLCPSCLFSVGQALPTAQETSTEPPSKPPSRALAAAFRNIGSYEVIEELGQGGMGVVFKARHRSLNRAVALKMLLLGRWTNPRFVERFRAEARAAAGLRHPAIVAIHEIGEHEGQPWFTMDFVCGPSVAELVREHPLPGRRAALLLRTVAEAVQYGLVVYLQWFGHRSRFNSWTFSEPLQIHCH